MIFHSFFVKKNQKNFYLFLVVNPLDGGLQKTNKVFLLLFLQKKKIQNRLKGEPFPTRPPFKRLSCRNEGLFVSRQDLASPEGLAALEDSGFELKEHSSEDLYWEFGLSRGDITLNISWSLIERSVQMVVFAAGHALGRFSSEGLARLEIKDGNIEAGFDMNGYEARMVACIGDIPHIIWANLQA